MRSSLPLLIITACAFAGGARAQTAAPSSGAIQRTATGSAAAQTSQTRSSAAHPSRRAPSRHPQSQGAPGTTQGHAQTGKADGVLALGATDITGNKELPKVMVIVPWKDSLGADGVIRPSDSLLDEVLGPVDRGVFQRQIRYYGQLNARQDRPAASRVAPVGDSH